MNPQVRNYLLRKSIQGQKDESDPVNAHNINTVSRVNFL